MYISKYAQEKQKIARRQNGIDSLDVACIHALRCIMWRFAVIYWSNHSLVMLWYEVSVLLLWTAKINSSQSPQRVSRSSNTHHALRTASVTEIKKMNIISDMLNYVESMIVWMSRECIWFQRLFSQKCQLTKLQ